MTKSELNKLIKGTRIGLTDRDKPALKAAQLYFVDGETNVAECAKKAGCIRQTAARTINRIKELIDQQGMVAVTVLVPTNQKETLEKFAANLKEDHYWCFSNNVSKAAESVRKFGDAMRRIHPKFGELFQQLKKCGSVKIARDQLHEFMAFMGSTPEGEKLETMEHEVAGNTEITVVLLPYTTKR